MMDVSTTPKFVGSKVPARWNDQGAWQHRSGIGFQSSNRRADFPTNGAGRAFEVGLMWLAPEKPRVRAAWEANSPGPPVLTQVSDSTSLVVQKSHEGRRAGVG